MYCTVCDKHLAHCTCPDIEERMAKLAQNPAISIAVAQNVLEREAVKKDIKPEEN
jgi:hypothetical protein